MLPAPRSRGAEREPVADVGADDLAAGCAHVRVKPIDSPTVLQRGVRPESTQDPAGPVTRGPAIGERESAAGPFPRGGFQQRDRFDGGIPARRRHTAGSYSQIRVALA